MFCSGNDGGGFMTRKCSRPTSSSGAADDLVTDCGCDWAAAADCEWSTLIGLSIRRRALNWTRTEIPQIWSRTESYIKNSWNVCQLINRKKSFDVAMSKESVRNSLHTPRNHGIFAVSDLILSALITACHQFCDRPPSWWRHQMEESFRVTGPLCGEFTGHRWNPHTKASDA